MLFSSLKHAGGGFDIEQLDLTVHGEIAPDRMREAFEGISRRHDVLRTAFRWEGLDLPCQDVYEDVAAPFEFRDLHQEPSGAGEASVQAFLAADRMQGFDLAEPPLSRLTLFRVKAREYRLIWTLHHVVVDGRSITLLLRELLRSYQRGGQEDRLTVTDPVPFRSFVEWQGRHLRATRESAEVYWKKTFDGFVAPTPLPGLTSGDPHAGPFQVGSSELHLSAELTSALRTFAERTGVTLNTVVQAAWALVLAKHSSSNDVLFGVTRACRHSTVPDSESIVGMFINTVPMRIFVHPELTVQEWLAGIRARHVAIRPFEHTPLHEIRSWAGLNDADRMFGSLLVFENYQMQDVLAASIDGVPVSVHLHEKTNFPLTLAAYAGTRLRFCLEYLLRSCGQSAGQRILRQLETVLAGIVGPLDRKLSDLPFLPEEERRTVLDSWNQTEDPSADLRTPAHRVFERWAMSVPDHLAVEDGDRRLTYRELNEWAERVAALSVGAGVEPGDLVGVFLERSVEAIASILGIMKAGAAYLPLDVTYPLDRLAFMIKDSRIQRIISTKALAARLPATQAALIDIDEADRTNPPPGEQKVKAASDDGLAYVIYTSGSTGEPKGVMIAHRSLSNYVHAARKLYEVTESDRVLQFSAFSFDASVEEIFVTLCSGATVVLRNDQMIATIGRFLATCDSMRITMLDLTTSFWHQLAIGLAEGGLRMPPSIRLVAVGGDRMMPQRLAQWREAVGPAVRLMNVYGPTETTVEATGCDLSRVTDFSRVGREVSIGRPMANYRAYVLDEQQRPVPIGALGELYIGGVGVGKGYLYQPELTAQRFLADPFVPEKNASMYRTGDLARWTDDGELEYAGRVDTQLKVRGYRVEPQEIESVLLEHPDVQDIAIVAREDPEGGKRLIAYVVPATADGRADVRARLREWAKGRLPGYMVPSGIVVVDQFPSTPSGKIDQARLPAPNADNFQTAHDLVPASDLVEQQLVGIWEKVLKRVPVGVTDSFFDLGGDSLVAIQLLTEVERLTGKALPMVTFFEAPTIVHLAALLRKEGWEPHWKSLVPIKATGSRRPFFCVHGVGGNILEFKDLVNHIDPDQPLFGIQAQGLDGRSPRLERVEDMAASYIKEIVAFQPQDPYFIGGSSFGGMVAYEIAQQLRRAGREIGALVLFDTYAPEYPEPLAARTAWKRKFDWWRYRIDLHLSNTLVADWRGKRKYVGEKSARFWRQIEAHRRRFSAGVVRQARELFLPRVYKDVKRSAVKAEEAYSPEPIDVPVYLLRATNQPYGIKEDRSNGWRKYVKRELTVVDIPGHHGAIMREPRVQALARALSECLRLAAEKARPSGTSGTA